MQDKEKIRQKKMFENITITHMFCLFAMLAAVLLSQDICQENIYPVLNIRGILLIGFIGFIAVALYNLRLWGITRMNPGSPLDKLLDFMYISLSLVVAIITLVITGDNSVHVEVIFVLPVIITASIMGKKPGTIMATICMAFLVSYDVYSSPGQSIYHMIENNLIVVCVVYVVGWFTGALTDLEKQYRAELTLAANTDIVTGLYNHRYFQEKITEYFSTDSKDFSLALIIIDVDYF
ncbi:MAG: diguanylate cyclase, partial [Syntrophomonadaceae bacterium]|nr:diguanylate cyclase [Syntrophomonadaceae bacterium]